MLDLIENELSKARSMAQQANYAFLVYLIDMAMIEVRATAVPHNNSLETLRCASGPIDRQPPSHKLVH